MNLVVIDDEKDIVDLIKYYFQQKGIQVEGYTDSEVGVKAIKKIKPDIIITDWLMPKMDGKEVVREIKSYNKTSDIPIIMLSCMTDFAEINSLFRLGLNDYVVKPINMRRLHDLVVDQYNVSKSITA